jgi:PRC-barrel domain
MNMRGLVLPVAAGLLLCAAAKAETGSVGNETREALDAAGNTLQETGEAVAAGAGRAAGAVGDALGDAGRAAAATGAAVADDLSEALRGLAVEDAEERVVVDDRGEEIGEVGEIVRSEDGLLAVVEAGGFLGIGESEVVVPVDRLEPAGEGRLRLSGATRETLEGFERYDAERYRPAPDGTLGDASDAVKGQ